LNFFKNPFFRKKKVNYYEYEIAQVGENYWEKEISFSNYYLKKIYINSNIIKKFRNKNIFFFFFFFFFGIDSMTVLYFLEGNIMLSSKIFIERVITVCFAGVCALNFNFNK